MSTLSADHKSLSQLFLEAFQIHGDLENSDDPTNSKDNQNKLKHALKLLELVMSRTRELELFSTNEEIDEISPVNLKYLIAPAVRGVLTSLLQSPREKRKSVLVEAEKYLQEFLQRCRDYAVGPLSEIDRSLHRKEINDATRASGRDLASLNAKREAKIARFKRDKELASRLANLKLKMSADDENPQNIDDDVVRKYWSSLIEKWIDISIENIENITQEKELVDFWENMPDKNAPTTSSQTNGTKSGGTKNFILTRDKVQAQVFGAGYPSLPTMTVEEYFDSCVAAGTLPDQATKSTGNESKQEESSDEEAENEKLKRQREFDDWKDTHRRGDGNRKNMG